MSLRKDWRVLYHMLLSPIRGESHAERLESFYQGQAEHYDDFRTRLLHGRRDLIQALSLPRNGVWVDMGGGTGSNLVYVGDALNRLAQVYVVDLSSSLLEVTRRRIQANAWTNVTAIEGDATRFVPPRTPIDLVTFSYSLTMIPDWFAALDHAWLLLRPGGVVGIVDFYVSRKYPPAPCKRHAWFTRTFWPLWFGFDNVFPSPDHVPYLHHRFDVQTFSEHTAPMPCAPGVRTPYYLFIGQKPKVGLD
jgi:S-adenosylmethionine-diacylgycerolhomoserine-N-methlytransferase